jgi:AraC-like DNA-binding protein
MLEVCQPAGDFSTPAVRELTLVEPISPGIRLTKRWGAARFNGIAPLGSVWIVPPQCAVKLEVYTQHTIRILTFDATRIWAVIAETRQDKDLSSAQQGPILDKRLHTAVSRLWSASPHAEGLEVDALLDDFAVTLSRVAGAPAPAVRGGLSTYEMRRAVNMLEADQAGTLRIEHLANEFGLSPYHFVRAFNASFGVPPYRFQKLSRLCKARRMLARTKKPVGEIATAVGYSSSEALARIFRQEMGISPTEFRNLRLI